MYLATLARYRLAMATDDTAFSSITSAVDLTQPALTPNLETLLSPEKQKEASYYLVTISGRAGAEIPI